MLSVQDIVAGYNEVLVLRGVSLRVEEGEIVALLGANGAGKTTTLKCILGLVPVRSGVIEFRGRRIEKGRTVDLVRQGLSMVFEGRRVFPELTVSENLLMGGYTVPKQERKERIEAILDRFPRLAERRNQLAGSLSGGEQQMLAIGRALMVKPRLLLLDEPSMGLAPKIVDEVFEIIREVNSSGTTILLVEQNAQRALGIADRAYVLETGKVAVTDSAENLIGNKAVQSAYLGM